MAQYNALLHYMIMLYYNQIELYERILHCITNYERLEQVRAARDGGDRAQVGAVALSGHLGGTGGGIFCVLLTVFALLMRLYVFV